MKILNRLLLVFLLLCFNSASATPGADVKILSEMWISLKEQISLMNDQISELKAASDSAKATSEVMVAVQEEYYFISNFNLDSEVNKIISDFTDLTYIDELQNAKTPEARYNLIRAEIDRRFKKENISNRDKKELEILKKRLAALEAYEKLRNKYLQEVLKPTSISTKDLQSRMSSSAAITATIALEEQLERKKAELLAREKLVDQMKWDAEFVQYLR